MHVGPDAAQPARLGGRGGTRRETADTAERVRDSRPISSDITHHNPYEYGIC